MPPCERALAGEMIQESPRKRTPQRCPAPVTTVLSSLGLPPFQRSGR